MGLISVITPAYNCGPFIKDTVQSVLGQTRGDLELIIVEDQSTDNTWEIINDLANTDDRIRILQNEVNQGPAYSRNRAIKLANGQYIAFLDGDDQWHPKKLETQIRFMREKKVDFSYTAYNRMTEEGEFIDVFEPDEKINYQTLLKSNQIGCLTAMYDTSSVGKMYMPDIRKRQDFGLWLDLLKLPNVSESRCVPSKEPLATYRIRKNSVSSNKLDLVKYNWSLLRRHQKLSLFAAGYYLAWQIYHKLRGK